MNEGRVILSGNVVTDVKHRETQDGLHIARFRLACTPRKRDKQSQQWVDGHTSYYTVTCWRFLAENVAASVRRGDPVIVIGDVQVRDWSTEDGRTGTSTEIDALSVGHDLNRGISEFHRVSRTRAVSPEEDEARRIAAALDDEARVDPATGEILDDGLEAGDVEDEAAA